jgi:hypothetical protein
MYFSTSDLKEKFLKSSNKFSTPDQVLPTRDQIRADKVFQNATFAPRS